MDDKKIAKIIITILSCIITCVGIAFGMSSCKVGRTITSKTQYINSGDSCITMTTQIVENYTGKKK